MFAPIGGGGAYVQTAITLSQSRVYYGAMDTPANHCQIAVVDDDEAILDAVQLVLESRGLHVRTYATGQDFIADLHHHKPDCIILEPHVRGVTAGTIARTIAPNGDRIPIIGLTTRPYSVQTRKIEDAGVRVILTKPVTAEKLVDEILCAISAAASV